MVLDFWTSARYFLSQVTLRSHPRLGAFHQEVLSDEFCLAITVKRALSQMDEIIRYLKYALCVLVFYPCCTDISRFWFWVVSREAAHGKGLLLAAGTFLTFELDIFNIGFLTNGF